MQITGETAYEFLYENLHYKTSYNKLIFIEAWIGIKKKENTKLFNGMGHNMAKKGMAKNALKATEILYLFIYLTN